MSYGTLRYARQDKGDIVKLFRLRPGTITIGREPGNDLVLKDDAVAPKHARLLCQPESCFVMDLGSEEGSALNGRRLKQRAWHRLHDGDIVQIGPFLILYTESQYTESQPEPSAGEPDGDAAPSGLVWRPEGQIGQSQASDRPAPLTLGPGDAFASARRLAVNRQASAGQAGAATLEQVSSYLQYLPPYYQENDFIGRFLLIFESILEPIEQMIEQIDYYFDPQLAPEALVPWLAGWFNILFSEYLSIEQQRQLIQSAAYLYARRGTRAGLVKLLDICTGGEKVQIVESGDPDSGAILPAYVFVVTVEARDPSRLRRALLEQIIDWQKPAHTSYRLEIRAVAGRDT